MEKRSGKGSKAGKPVDINRLARDLIDSQSTMTLATTDGEEAWAAPVYYVFFDQGFYFLSSPESRHILDGCAARKSAAAIHQPADGWEEIRGLQMSGVVKHVSLGMEATRAIKKYLVKFPFCKEFFPGYGALGMELFRQEFRVELYRFQPEKAYYSDNRISFGFRDTVVLAAS